MNAEYLTCLTDVTTHIRSMRERLPNIDQTELAQLNDRLAALNLSGAQVDEVEKLKEAFMLLANEISETLQSVNEYCVQLRSDLNQAENHSHGVIAYTVAQQNK